MKFGRDFSAGMIPEWRFYYMDYDGLKRMLKERTAEGKFFAERDEATFVTTLDDEMTKVFDFRDVKAGELTRHVQHCENAIKSGVGASTDKESLLQEIERITEEVSQLAAFSRVNHTAFLKILKKHDKHTEFMLRPMFMMRLTPRSSQTETLDGLIYRLSRLFDRLRRGPDAEGPGRGEGGPGRAPEAQAFVRKTTKYWVHPDNVMEVKCTILRHLPVLVFPNEQRKVDPAISSVYLDNERLELYRGRLQKDEGAEAVRLRWYGSGEPASVFIERKTHKEDWTGETSVKERFLLKEKHVAEYLSGQFKADEVVEKVRKHETAEMGGGELDKVRELAEGVQDTVLVKGLRPTLRTFYNRTAFQLPGDARVRVSLDTDLCMIQEDVAQAGEWKRSDIGVAHPFVEVSPEQIVRFPYAILEVKLQVEGGQEAPAWIGSLVDGPLVEAVPKFSKFIHGVATLFHDRIDVQPYWLPQMAADIRKPRMPRATSEGDDDDSEARVPSVMDDKGKQPKVASGVGHVSIEMPDEEDEKTPLLGSSSMGRSRSKGEKRIAVPVRVEPKVFFANERTFLSWIHFSIFLGGISTALVGLGNQNARISGFLFAGVSILFTGYALYLYKWRAARIRARDPGPYDDLIGPTLVATVFLIAMVANVLFTLAAPD